MTSFSAGFCVIHRVGFTGHACPRCGRRWWAMRAWIADVLERFVDGVRGGSA